MSTKVCLTVSAWLVTLGLVFWLGISVGQQSAPTKNKGTTKAVLVGVDIIKP